MQRPSGFSLASLLRAKTEAEMDVAANEINKFLSDVKGDNIIVAVNGVNLPYLVQVYCQPFFEFGSASLVFEFIGDGNGDCCLRINRKMQ